MRANRLILTLGSFVAAAAVAVLIHRIGYDAFLELLRQKVSPPVFVVLMIVLPAVGFPISPFLVLSGLKFGFLPGAAIAGVTTLLHLACAFGVGHSFLRPRIVKAMKRRDLHPPKLTDGKRYLATFLFVVFPGLPYSLKNYLLAASNLSLSAYIALTWMGQMLIALPFIGLGQAAGQLHWALGAAVVLILCAGYLILKLLARRPRRLNGAQSFDNSDET